MSGGQQRLLLFDARLPCTTTAPPAEPRFPKNVEIENEGASHLNVSRWSPPSVDTCVDVSACLFKFNAIAVHVLVVPESKSSQPASRVLRMFADAGQGVTLYIHLWETVRILIHWLVGFHQIDRQTDRQTEGWLWNQRLCHTKPP